MRDTNNNNKKRQKKREKQLFRYIFARLKERFFQKLKLMRTLFLPQNEKAPQYWGIIDKMRVHSLPYEPILFQFEPPSFLTEVDLFFFVKWKKPMAFAPQ